MEASALCDTIFAFMGQGQGPSTAAKLIVRTTNPAIIEGGPDGESGEPTGETSPEPFSVGQASGDPINTGGSSSTGQDTQQQLEKEGAVLTFVGNKLGEYNLRGVEAGMNMVAIGTKKSGKVLNTKNRRQKRGARSPYERRSIHDKEPGC